MLYRIHDGPQPELRRGFGRSMVALPQRLKPYWGSIKPQVIIFKVYGIGHFFVKFNNLGWNSLHQSDWISQWLPVSQVSQSVQISRTLSDYGLNPGNRESFPEMICFLLACNLRLQVLVEQQLSIENFGSFSSSMVKCLLTVLVKWLHLLAPYLSWVFVFFKLDPDVLGGVLGLQHLVEYHIFVL